MDSGIIIILFIVVVLFATAVWIIGTFFRSEWEAVRRSKIEAVAEPEEQDDHETFPNEEEYTYVVDYKVKPFAGNSVFCEYTISRVYENGKKVYVTSASSGTTNDINSAKYAAKTRAKQKIEQLVRLDRESEFSETITIKKQV